ncbi:MAG TPA: hypothetical protein VM840_01090 [Actinomycetota bacterium]|nr:hypothetical protein [Actinomycetota bacterium]
MRALAALITAWAVLRWVALGVGVLRARRFPAPVRREARRSAVSHSALDVFVSVSALYAWAYALQLQPVERFVGMMAAVMMLALMVGVAAWFMQPEERSPEVWGLFRLRPGRRGSPSVGQDVADDFTGQEGER